MTTVARPPVSPGPAPTSPERKVLRGWPLIGLVGGLMLGLFLSALEGTAVSTAIPTIVGELGGIELYTWVFSAYLLTSTTTVPIYGKLADIYGRKRLFIGAVALFIVGSLACGAAQSMEQLVAFRAIQGIGAGGILPISMTIIGDSFSLQQRAQVQGFFGSVWGGASILGPAAGGLVTDLLSWRWLFLINLPLGLLCIALVAFMFRESFQARRRSIDYIGAAAITVGTALLLLALVQAGQPDGVLQPGFLLCVAGAIAMAVLYIWNQARVPEPVVPLSILRHPIIGPAALVTLMGGTAMYGLTSFVPLFAQGVLGGSALLAGAVVAPMSFFWPVASFINSRLLLNGNYIPSLIAGAILTLAGGVMTVFITPATGWVWAILAGSVFGLGMGFLNPTGVIAAQNAVGWAERGVTTALMQFARTIGGAIGVTAMGVVLTAGLLANLPADLPGLPADARLDATNSLLDPALRAQLPPATVESLQNALMAGLSQVYGIVLGFAVLAAAAAVFFIIQIRRTGARPDDIPPD